MPTLNPKVLENQIKQIQPYIVTDSLVINEWVTYTGVHESPNNIVLDSNPKTTLCLGDRWKVGYHDTRYFEASIVVPENLAIAIALITTFIFNRTRVGLNLRAIGESAATADAMGVNVTVYKYVAILIGSGIAGFGGVFYIMDYVKGSWENASTIEAFGWLAIALVIFTLWKPNISIIGSYLFGALYIAAFVFGNISFSEREILKMLPYVITIIVLIVTSMMNKKENQPPQNLGLNYFREER